MRGKDAAVATVTMTVPMMTTKAMTMEGGGCSGGEEGQRCHDNQSWLLHLDQSKGIALGAFQMLNDKALDGAGVPL
jgi:hypothetical protein